MTPLLQDALRPLEFAPAAHGLLLQHRTRWSRHYHDGLQRRNVTDAHRVAPQSNLALFVVLETLEQPVD